METEKLFSIYSVWSDHGTVGNILQILIICILFIQYPFFKGNFLLDFILWYSVGTDSMDCCDVY